MDVYFLNMAGQGVTVCFFFWDTELSFYALWAAIPSIGGNVYAAFPHCTFTEPAKK